MGKLMMAAGAMVLLCCGGEENEDEGNFPCTCIIRQVDTNPDSGMPIYEVEFNLEDCNHPQTYLAEDAPDIEEQMCDEECAPAYRAVSNSQADSKQAAKNSKAAAQRVQYVFTRTPAKLDKKQDENYKPKPPQASGQTVTPLGIVQFLVQGEAEPYYASLFLITGGKSGHLPLAVGYEIGPVGPDKVHFKLDELASFRNVSPIKLKRPDGGVTVVPQQLHVKVRGIESIVLTTSR